MYIFHIIEHLLFCQQLANIFGWWWWVVAVIDIFLFFRLPGLLFFFSTQIGTHGSCKLSYINSIYCQSQIICQLLKNKVLKCVNVIWDKEKSQLVGFHTTIHRHNHYPLCTIIDTICVKYFHWHFKHFIIIEIIQIIVVLLLHLQQRTNHRKHQHFANLCSFCIFVHIKNEIPKRYSIIFLRCDSKKWNNRGCRYDFDLFFLVANSVYEFCIKGRMINKIH